MANILWRLNSMWWRLRSFVFGFPLRLRRLFVHVGQGLGRRYTFAGLPKGAIRTLVWWWEFLLLVSDLLGLPLLYETFLDWVKWSTRPLNEVELRIGRWVFGDSINWPLVRLDERAYVGCRRYQFAYVSFNTINSWGGMPPPIFVHELVHVWQYQHLGAVYLSRALLAQRTPMGYNYGGVSMLRDFRKRAKTLLDFNYEQQADIIADYYRLASGRGPQWGTGGQSDLPLYQAYVLDLERS
ncbi:MAG: hypothetical protein KDC44_16035 [Phaeodactylibacter sp.]|nr:hypothetical protein [Phaeodactylibacter sp.]